MSEEKQNNQDDKEQSLLKKILTFALHSPVQAVFILLTLFYALRIFILGQNDFVIEMQAIGVVFLWVLWNVAKSIIKLLLFIALLLVGAYGYYYYTHHDEIACEKSGGYWNDKEEVCEEKGNLWQQFIRLLKFE